MDPSDDEHWHVLLFENDIWSDKVKLDFGLVLSLSLKTVVRFSFHGTILYFDNVLSYMAFSACIAVQ